MRRAPELPGLGGYPFSVFEDICARLEVIADGLDGSGRGGYERSRAVWARMLDETGILPADEAAARRLFVAHSCLVRVARSLLERLCGATAMPEAVFAGWIGGAGAVSLHWTEMLQEAVHRTDWSRDGDMLRTLYERLTGQRERRAGGEFYTPDWLAAIIVDRVLDDEWCERAVEAARASRTGHVLGTGVIDPACGSGTLLWHAVRKLLRTKAAEGLPARERSSVVARLVHGVDVHPVAALLARASLVCALGSPPAGGADALHIHWGDGFLVLGREPNSRLKMLASRKVDRLLANPPWYSTASLGEHGYRKVLEDLANEIGVRPGGAHAPHLDVAQIAAVRMRQVWLQDPDSDAAAWIVKSAALTAGSWAGYRERHAPENMSVLDLQDVQPFGPGEARRCCVLFEHCTANPGNLVARRKTGAELLRSWMGIEEALERIEIVPAGAAKPSRPSGWQGKDAPTNGVTLYPRVLTMVRRTGPESPAGVPVETLPSMKRPWNAISPQTGHVPAQWLRETVTSAELAPFIVRETEDLALVPVDMDGNFDSEAGATSAFWARLEGIYRDHRGPGRHTPATVLERLDYNRRLSAQLARDGTARSQVLHPVAGDIMRAARNEPGRAIVDHTLNLMQASSPAEAAFLVALLNAPSLKDAFAQAKSTGRHFRRALWQIVPVPRYDGSDPVHRRLAGLCRLAEARAAGWLADQPDGAPSGQVAVSAGLRQMLGEAGLLDAIDREARLVLPDHADPEGSRTPLNDNPIVIESGVAYDRRPVQQELPC